MRNIDTYILYKAELVISMGYSQLAKKPTRQKTNSPNSKSPKNQLAKFWSTRQKTLVNSPKFISQLPKFLFIYF